MYGQQIRDTLNLDHVIIKKSVIKYGKCDALKQLVKEILKPASDRYLWKENTVNRESTEQQYAKKKKKSRTEVNHTEKSKLNARDKNRIKIKSNQCMASK